MALNKRVAVTLPAGPKLSDTIARLTWAEENGFPDAWFSDSGAPDTLTQVAAVAHHTRSIRIGVAVTPVYTRTPAVIAASVNVIAQLLPERFVMGKSDFQGETVSSRGYRQAPLENPPPVYIGALRPKMIEMAAEFGDGVIFNLWPKSALPKMMEHVRIGAERAGKSVADVEIVNRAMVLATDDKERGRNLFRAAFAPYYATPVYNKFLAWAGYREAADTITEGWAEKDRAKTTSALTDDVIDEIAIIGTEDEIRDRIRADAEGGVHTSIIAPIAATPQDVERTFDAFRADVFQF
jgi:alkanesulfonate monooxygenase SsuD/methylene tetrahydromethanopterin reductase-like flavin-dependent oxidoreductase (luciferase family)